MLTPTDRTLLDLAARSYRYPGARESAIRDQLDLSTTQFFQRLNVLLETEAALAHNPVTVRRLRRVRDGRLRVWVHSE